MHMKIATKLLVILIILSGLTVINITAQTSQSDSVNNSAGIQLVPSGEKRTLVNDCENDLQIANQRLAKTLDALEQSETVIKTLQAEIATRKNLQTLSDDLINKKDQIIANQTKLIAEYEKQKGLTISFLFGLIKIRKN